MRADGLLTVVAHGGWSCYKCTDTQLFLDYLASQYNLTDLEATLSCWKSKMHPVLSKYNLPVTASSSKGE